MDQHELDVIVPVEEFVTPVAVPDSAENRSTDADDDGREETEEAQRDEDQ